MDLKLDKAELETLVELLAMAEWTLSSNDDIDEDDPRKDKHLKLLSKVYKHAYENGLNEAIEHIKDVDAYYPTDHWEEGSMCREFIDEYDEASFWDSLVERLTFKELDKVDAKQFDDLASAYEEIAEPLYREFDENGLDNVVVNIKK